MKKATVFEDTYRDYLAQIAGIDLFPKAERLGAEALENALIIPFYGKPHRISKEGVFNASGKRANFAISVVLCRYVLQCPPEIPLNGEWITYRELKDAGPLVGYFISNTTKIIETAFAGNTAALEAASQSLGGRFNQNESSYDLSITFDFLPRLPVYLRFNDKDDEFPAQCSLLFRQSAEKYLDMECLSIGGTYLTGALIGKNRGTKSEG